ncbi:MAG: DNA/RNA nuclease SfsA [Halobacteriovoraceae bacterium]|nr:DNA/RNA nuclease SfsA [Halobacteriovoraceae bacterium]
MNFEVPIITGKILNRYKRFLADIELDNGDIITAHTANTGSMNTCWEKNWPALLSYHDNPKRKLKYSLEMTHNGDTWIGVNTAIPNRLGQEAFYNHQISEFQSYNNIKPEVKIGKSRIDLVLYNGEYNSTKDKMFVEIKNVTLLGKNREALFPDAVSERGQKHLEELIDLKLRGYQCAMLYIIQREDVDSFRPAHEIDQKYGELLIKAHNVGVKILPYRCELSQESIKISHKLPFNL